MVSKAFTIRPLYRGLGLNPWPLKLRDKHHDLSPREVCFFFLYPVMVFAVTVASF